MRDCQTMAWRVRGYVTQGKTDSYGTPTARYATTSQRKALATIGRRGGKKAAKRWETDPEGEYAQGRRQVLKQTHRRRGAEPRGTRRGAVPLWPRVLRRGRRRVGRQRAGVEGGAAGGRRQASLPRIFGRRGQGRLRGADGRGRPLVRGARLHHRSRGPGHGARACATFGRARSSSPWSGRPPRPCDRSRGAAGGAARVRGRGKAARRGRGCRVLARSPSRRCRRPRRA